MLDPPIERRAAVRGELLDGQRSQLASASDLGLPRLRVNATVRLNIRVAWLAARRVWVVETMGRQMPEGVHDRV